MYVRVLPQITSQHHACPDGSSPQHQVPLSLQVFPTETPDIVEQNLDRLFPVQIPDLQVYA